MIVASESVSQLYAPLFARHALIAMVLLAAAGGIIGSWIVLRRLAFFTHAVGTGAYPGLVIGPLAGLGTLLSAAAGTVAFAALYGLVRRRARSGDMATALLLVCALAAGTLVAQSSLAGGHPVSPETALFGSVLTLSATQIWASAALLAIAALVALVTGMRWTANGLDERSGGLADVALIAVVCLLVIVSLPALGALLVAATTVVPAATARLLTRRVGSLVALAGCLAIAEAIAGLTLALEFNTAPGAMVALVAAAVFGLVAIARSLPTASRLVAPATGLAIMLALAGCGGSETSTSRRITVVATTPIVADIVRNVAGDDVDVVTLLPAGADPETYEPRPSDAAALAGAAVVFRSGGAIDDWITPSLNASGNSHRPVDLSAAAILRQNGSLINPHWFLDPGNIAAAAQRVRIELTKAAPQSRETYRYRAHLYGNQLMRKDRLAAACLARLPNNRRAIVTDHDAFDYLAAHYGLTVAARLVNGNSHGQPSAAAAAAAQKRIAADRIPVVVVVRGENTAVARSIASRGGARVIELYGDTLAASGPAASIAGAISADVDGLARTLSSGRLSCRSSK